MHINPTIMIPITIGSYPILDQPPSYSAAVNTIAPVDASINLNTNEADATVNLRSALSAILNNEQVVRPQSTPPSFDDDAKTTNVDVNAPFPHYGESPYHTGYHMFGSEPVTCWHNL